MVTPLASSVQASWERLLGGESGISRIKDFNVSDIRCKIAGQVPNGRWAHGFKPDHWVARKEQRRLAACRTEAHCAARPVDMMEKPLRALPVSSRAQ